MTGRFLIFRDLQVAEDIGARAKLGWFDHEFNFYGTAYYKNGEEYYMISSNPNRIYDFIQTCLEEEVYCSPLQRYTRKCPVPSGMGELMAKDFKILLGKQLQRNYQPAFLQGFQDTFRPLANDSAGECLYQWQEKIDGLFDGERLQLFHLLVQAAYGAKVLLPATFQTFCRWIADVYADMGDDLIVKDVYRRDLYSLTYWEGDHRRVVINAQKDRLWVKAYELLDKGILSTPIYGKTYWYNHDYRLSDARKDYEAYLSSALLLDYLDTAEQINRLPGAIDKGFYREKEQHWLQQYGASVAPYLQYYKMRWRCGD